MCLDQRPRALQRPGVSIEDALRKLDDRGVLELIENALAVRLDFGQSVPKLPPPLVRITPRVMRWRSVAGDSDIVVATYLILTPSASSAAICPSQMVLSPTLA
jgi:hypothetical protein